MKTPCTAPSGVRHARHRYLPQVVSGGPHGGVTISRTCATCHGTRATQTMAASRETGRIVGKRTFFFVGVEAIK